MAEDEEPAEKLLWHGESSILSISMTAE